MGSFHRVWASLVGTGNKKHAIHLNIVIGICCLMLTSGRFHDLFAWIRSRQSVAKRRFVQIVLLFVRSVALPVALNHGSQLSRSYSWVGQTQLLPLSHSQTNHDRAMLRSSTVVNQHNIKTKFLLAEERFMFGIGKLLPGWLLWLLSPRVFTAKQSVNEQRLASQRQQLVGGAGSRVSENERYERDKLKRGMRYVLSC